MKCNTLVQLTRAEKVAVMQRRDYYATDLVPRTEAVMSALGIASIDKDFDEVTTASNRLWMPGRSETSRALEVVRFRRVLGGDVVKLAWRQFADGMTGGRVVELSPQMYEKSRRVRMASPETQLWLRGDELATVEQYSAFETMLVESERELARRQAVAPEDTPIDSPHLAVPESWVSSDELPCPPLAWHDI